MLLSDITFLLILIPLAVIFTILAFVWKGILWFGLLGGISWLLFGFFCLSRADAELFYYQRPLAALFIFVGIAVMFVPFYAKAKDADIEENAPDDIDIWGEQHKKHRERIDKRKNLRKSNRREQE